MKKKLAMYILHRLGVNTIIDIRKKSSISVEKINNPLEKIQTIASLKQHIQQMQNKKKYICNLQEYGSNLCLYRGNLNAKIMVIGEGPGKDEDIAQQPFVGRSGKLLQWLLDAANIDAYITNTVFWRPPGNRTPHQHEIDACAPYLEQQIRIINPQAILLCGQTALQATVNTNLTITKARGTIFKDKFGININCIPTFHPAYIIRNLKKKPLMWSDIIATLCLIRNNVKY